MRVDIRYNKFCSNDSRAFDTSSYRFFFIDSFLEISSQKLSNGLISFFTYYTMLFIVLKY